MLAIKQLLKISDQVDIQFDLLKADSFNDTSLQKIYKEIKSESFSFDLDSKKNNKLFNQFLDELSDRILLGDLGKSNKRQLSHAYFKILKQYLVGRMLLLSYMYDAGERVILKCIKQAMKYEFTELVYPGALRLFDKYTLESRYKAAAVYKDVYKKYLDLYTIEGQVFLDLKELISHYNRTKSSDKDISIRAQELLAHYKQIGKSSRRIEMNLIYIEMIKFTAENDSFKVYEASKRGYNYFNSLNYDDDEFKLVLLYQQLTYLTQIKDLTKANLIIMDCLTKVKKGESHWFRVKEHHLLLLLYTGNYDEATELFFTVYRNKRFEDLLTQHQERWRLFEAYVHFLLEANISTYDGKKKSFSINKFLNNLPGFSKDKRAMNIPILIAQLLFLIVRKKYSDAIDRIEALEKYSSRYLKNNDTYRSNCFLKAILEIPKKGFHQIAVQRSASKYLDKLKSSDIQLVNQPFEIEIIPYEQLWEIIINYLGTKHHFG